MPDQESIVLEVDPRSVLTAINQANQAVEGWEQGTVGAGERMQKSLERMGEMLLKVNDRSRSSLERLTQSIEKQAAAYGKAGVDRLVGERDRLIKKLGDEQVMVDRVRAAYEKMIAVEQNAGGGGAGATGFSARYAIFGVKDVFEGRGQFAIAEAANELMRLRGSALAVGGAVAGVAALGFAAYEVAKKLREIREEPERIAAEFTRLTGATKTANDEMRVANDRLENAIAKLQHRPQNNLKLAIDEAAVAADHLSEKMDKVLRSFADMAVKNAPGVFASILGQAGTDDLVKLVQGKSGYGGLIGDLYKATSGAGDPTKVLGQYRAAVGTMIRQSEMAEAYQHGKGYEGVGYEDIRGAMMGRGKLPPGLHFENMLADQGTRLETLRALEREIDLLGQSYGLEKKNSSLTAQEGRLKEGAKSSSVTEELRQQVARAQEGELSGLARINAAYQERLRHLKEEGELNSVNVKLAGQIRDAEIARFQKEEERKTAAAVFGANSGLGEAGIRSNFAMFQANRKVSGAAFGEADINAEYDNALALAQKQFDVAGRHVREMREMNATEGEIQRAQIEATKNFALAALDAETKKRVELIDLAKQQRDEESKTARANYENARRLGDAAAGERERRERDTLQRQIKMAEAFGSKVSGGQVATALTVEQLRIAAAQMQHSQALARVGQESIEAQKLPGGTPEERRQRDAELNRLKIEGLKAEGELQRQIDDAHQDRVVKILELQKREMEEIQNKAAGLFHTLFTKPEEFGKQLANTMKEAVLKPITEGLGGLVAGAIHPLIYGSDGQGGIAGIFKGIFGGGKQDPLRAATDLNTAVTAQNSFAVAGLTAVMAAVMGAGAPAVAAPAGMPGVSVPTISVPAVGGQMEQGGFTLPGLSRASGTSQVPAIMRAAMGGGSASAGGGGGGTWANNLRASWGSLKSFAGFGNMVTDSQGTRWATTAGGEYIPLDSIGGWANAAGRSPAAGMAGSMLAMNGLVGSGAGTWRGVMEGTAGGALLGFQAGGPLGAAIGASIGLEIGVAEKLFGVETKENEAKRLVKQIYSISIDTQMAKQIVALAQQKYGGRVSVAVRDPDVRKMLMIYSEGTGQKMPLSATTPYGGSLAEQGGKLFQQATYQDGQAHVYSSGLPTLGGIAAAAYPASGSPTYLSLNISGSDAANFMTGQFVTPQFVTDQAMAAQYSSYGRTQQSANMQLPGLTVA